MSVKAGIKARGQCFKDNSNSIVERVNDNHLEWRDTGLLYSGRHFIGRPLSGVRPAGSILYASR